MLAGLYAATFLSAAMGALLGADTLSGEIISGTIQTIVSKPVRRSDVVLGKWLGFAILLAVYSLLMSGGTVLSVWLQSGYAPRNVLQGLSLIYLEALLIMTIALSCSSFLSGLATGGVVFGLYGLSFIGGWVEQIGSYLQNETAIRVGIVTSLIIPSESLWRRAAFRNAVAHLRRAWHVAVRHDLRPQPADDRVCRLLSRPDVDDGGQHVQSARSVKSSKDLTGFRNLSGLREKGRIGHPFLSENNPCPSRFLNPSSKSVNTTDRITSRSLITSPGAWR
ncbi:MAG: ABC transporter permease [Chloroflexi bacterium]|nr:ABC transporter permease [Chloroflexota bacterium]